MTPDFIAPGLIDRPDLPPAVRARLYRDLAADARREAENAKGAARECYELIAENWEKLAAKFNPRKRVDRRKKSRTVPDRRKR